MSDAVRSGRVALLGTGGTIASAADENGDVSARLPIRQLLADSATPAGLRVDPVLDISCINSWDMTPADMWAVAKQVCALLSEEDVEGVVVTHGTDTIEETAFAVDLAVAGEKPVVFAAAMRSADALSADGPRTLHVALSVASDPQMRGLGTLVTMSDEVHAARWVRKVRTHGINAFASPVHGPVARFGPTGQLSPINPPRGRWWGGSVEPTDRVVLITPYTGGHPDLPRLSVEHEGARGLVLDAFGVGNLPASLMAVVCDLVREGVVVVVASRVLGGGVFPLYGGQGGGAELARAGVVFAGELSAAKARLLLMMCLSGASSGEARRRFIDAVSILT